jgi:hypothetical protein
MGRAFSETAEKNIKVSDTNLVFFSVVSVPLFLYI